jgi:hypothetical protein
MTNFMPISADYSSEWESAIWVDNAGGASAYDSAIWVDRAGGASACGIHEILLGQDPLQMANGLAIK